MTRFFALIIGSSFLLGGCNVAKNLNSSIFGSDSTEKGSQEKTISLSSAQKRYDKAYRSMSRERYEEALEEYSELIIQYPFGKITEQAKLDSLFVLHKLGQTEDAKRVANSFIEQYPTHENVDYAYYMKGIILFPKKKGMLGQTFGTSSLRNASGLLEAHAALGDFINKFPESEQAPDAKQRMIFLENAIAQDELNVAKFYVTKKAYVAVINRCQFIVEEYARTPSARDALFLMRDTYTKMGLVELAQNTQTVIDANYDPSSQSSKSKKAKKGFSFPALKMPKLFKKKDKA